jgi:hypothetical protein
MHMAEQIAAERKISYTEALPLARRQFAAGDVPTVVTRNTGSPLRDQQQSTTPQPGEVRKAVDAGLRAKPWTPGGGDPAIWWATSGAQAIRDAMQQVGSRLRALGMGPQIISALTTEMQTFLNNATQGTGIPPISDIIAATCVHVQQTYARALANKVDSQVWAEERFDERGLVPVVNGGYVPVRRGSVQMAERAWQIEHERGIEFGEALRIARHEQFAADVADAQQLEEAVATALKTVLTTIFEGKQQKQLDGMDVLKAIEAVSKALTQMNISGVPTLEMALRDSLDDSTSGVTNANEIDSIISKAVTAVQRAYAQVLAG